MRPLNNTSEGISGTGVAQAPESNGRMFESIEEPKPTLLIVDDQAINVQTLHQIFKADYRILIATDGPRAIDLCHTGKPDLILLDVVMPDMDGYAVCKTLKSNESTAHVPIIFITGHATAEEECKCLEAGAVDFISKPVNPVVVRSRVRTHLTLKKQTDQLRLSANELACAQRLGNVGSWTLELASGKFTGSDHLGFMLGLEPSTVFSDISALKPLLRGTGWFRLLRSIATAKAGIRSSSVELAYCKANAPERVLMSNIEPVTGPTGEVVAVRGTMLDITERKIMEELRTAKDAAELSSRHKTRFLSSMSHELRTPLNAVLGFAELLSGSPSLAGDDAALVKLGHIRSAGQQLLSMVEDVLDYASIESGKIHLSLEAVDVAQVVHECIELMRQKAQARALQLDWSHPDAGIYARADRRRLKKILLNLLSNAINYNRQGGQIRVQVKSAAMQVQVSIQDEGPGLTQQQQAQLFEPFNRLGAENSKIPGSGLGLALTRLLTQEMGGGIEVLSQPGCGATFTVCFDQS